MTRIIQECTKLRRIALCNLLSFGPSMEPLVLENLNILIGPNGAGKSNLIEAISLMRAAPGDIRSIVRRGGGAGEWIWKGGEGLSACIDFVMDNPQGNRPLRHVLSFREDAMGFRLEDERIENETTYERENEPYFYYRFSFGLCMAKDRWEYNSFCFDAWSIQHNYCHTNVFIVKTNSEFEIITLFKIMFLFVINETY